MSRPAKALRDEDAACLISSMEQDATSEQIINAADGFWQQVELFLRTMLLPSRLNQVGAILLLLLVAHLLARALSPRLRVWLRHREGWPKWRLRLGLMIDRRLRLIMFTAMAWGAVLIMRQITWPSRSQVIAEAAAIATAVLAIAFLSRLIANALARRIAKWAAWIWAVLYLLDMSDNAARLLDSIALSVGGVRLSMLTVIQALAVITALIAGARLITAAVTRKLAESADLSPTMRVLVAKLLQITLFTLAIMIGLRAIGLDLTGLAVFSGAVGVGIGFGLQKVVSNLVSGVIILLDKSVKPGDVISLGDTFGWIDALGARYVSVVTRDGKEYLIPNEDLVTNQVVNWSHTNDFVRLDVHFGTSYRDDPHMVSKVAINAAMSVKRVLAQRTPVCWITGFGDSSVDYVLRFWISDAQGGLTNVRGQVYLALWDAFKEAGVSVPYPQREVRILADADSADVPKFIAGD
ncbi:mechanosensitive ion channel family protein [Paracoccus xiamenensis]|uniref:mechanosensitive ion channel family protein n=1 Tax=Paracoccus xiamenensis TaxID=2714901 RepID=UPI001F1982BC|nr:mechanosensitive ion channel domain-containing protein [Paracoccus xiamenensis]